MKRNKEIEHPQEIGRMVVDFLISEGLLPEGTKVPEITITKVKILDDVVKMNNKIIAGDSWKKDEEGNYTSKIIYVNKTFRTNSRKSTIAKFILFSYLAYIDDLTLKKRNQLSRKFIRLYRYTTSDITKSNKYIVGFIKTY